MSRKAMIMQYAAVACGMAGLFLGMGGEGNVQTGGDTDTNAAITGGLAGAWFGFSAIPARWVDALAPGLRQDLDILAAAAESHRSK